MSALILKKSFPLSESKVNLCSIVKFGLGLFELNSSRNFRRANSTRFNLFKLKGSTFKLKGSTQPISTCFLTTHLQLKSSQLKVRVQSSGWTLKTGSVSNFYPRLKSRLCRDLAWSFLNCKQNFYFSSIRLIPKERNCEAPKTVIWYLVFKNI